MIIKNILTIAINEQFQFCIHLKKLKVIIYSIDTYNDLLRKNNPIKINQKLKKLSSKQVNQLEQKYEQFELIKQPEQLNGQFELIKESYQHQEQQQEQFIKKPNTQIINVSKAPEIIIQQNTNTSDPLMTKKQEQPELIYEYGDFLGESFDMIVGNALRIRLKNKTEIIPKTASTKFLDKIGKRIDQIGINNLDLLAKKKKVVKFKPVNGVMAKLKHFFTKNSYIEREYKMSEILVKFMKEKYLKIITKEKEIAKTQNSSFFKLFNQHNHNE